MARTHKRVLQRLLQDPDFRREYEASGPTSDLILALFKLRTEAGLTQEQVAQRGGANLVDIGRMESTPGSLTLKALARIAGAVGADLVLRFEPEGGRPPTHVRIPARSMLAKGLIDRFE